MHSADRMAENSATKLLKTSRPQLKIMHGKPRHGMSHGVKRDHKENLNAEKYYQKLGWKLEIYSIHGKPECRKILPETGVEA
jgi:hypothetical protein